VAYQFLIVVAGGTGSAGGGNPFKGQYPCLYLLLGKQILGWIFFFDMPGF